MTQGGTELCLCVIEDRYRGDKWGTQVRWDE